MVTIWNRIKSLINVKKLGILISLTLVCLAIYILIKKLKNVSWAHVGDYMAQTPTQSLILAGLCVVAAYLTLTFYDYFAVKTIGKTISYKEAAIASFTSYSIAHNIGATVFTATLVRYLNYSRFGFSASDVVKVSFIAGLTFWLGNATVLGLGFTLEPKALAPIFKNLSLTPFAIELLGIGILAALFSYIGFMHFGKRQIGKGEWQITFPSSTLTLLQMVIGIIDLTFCALVMYILMPKGINVPFREFMVIFVASMLLGFASNTPGGLGAFEAAIILALPKVDREQLIAAVILFRLYYFIAPFIFALITVFFREFVFSKHSLADLKHSMDEVRSATKKEP